MPLFLTFTLILISSVLLMSFFWHIETSNMMDKWNCIQSQFGWSADDLLMKYQYISDYATALALSSVSAELFYFVHKSTVLQYKWVGVQFGAVIVLCGATHYINLWTFTKHSRTVVIVLTTAKLLTSLVSSATSITLMDVIPYLLNGETKESILKNKTTELDTEMGLIRTQEETSRHAKMLTHEITSTLGRRIILKTTIELHD